MIGKSISHYRVTEKLGEGGMGVVYRATDTKLGRDVALKVLPPVFADDSERMALFKQEAHVLASLNHPHIASIYGLEEAGGIHCLVLELVEGPTLAERIQEGAVSLEESLKISKQIAEALEAAHEKGVIHRDLKPANVKVTPEGMVKVLDFGLAKALAEPASEAEIQNAPTQRLASTETGIILGTAAYMGPEQARGQKVDKRADIWAFGVVLFEMLTGKRTFEGQSVSDTLAAVIMGEPNWEALPSGTPAPIQNLLHRCLEKDRTQRLQAIGEARITIDKYFADPAASSMQITVAPATIQPLWRRALPWAVAGLFALIAAVAFWVIFGSPATELVRPPMRLSIEVAPSEPLWLNPGPIVAISPDGTRLVYVGGTEPGPRRLYLRPIDRLVATPMSGTEGADDPFFSPDGEWVGSFAGGKLKKAFVHGGPPVTLADAPVLRGGSWGPDGSILFTPNSNAGLFRVSAAGGGVAEATTLDSENDEHSHRWPDILPGGKAVSYTTRSRREDETIYRNIDVVSLETGERKALIEGGIYGRYLPTGHIAYVWEGTLLAVPFDLGRLEVTGTPLPLLDNVSMNTGRGSAQVGFSQTGTLVYLTGERATDAEFIFWMDREGKIDPLLSTPRDYSRLRFSPDGTHLAFTLTQEDRIELWVAPVETAKARRLLEARLNAAVARRPCSWVSDSRTLVCTIVPSGQERPPAPAGPILQESTGRRAPARTYQDLLKSPFDEQLFDYYGTSQIIRVGLDGATQVIGRRGIHSEISPSPDGKYLLVETIHRPYSYLVPRGRFPYRVEVWNFEGNVVKQIADLPLAENVPVPRGSVPTGPRNFGWRADVGAELYWTEAQDVGDAGRKAEVRDKVFTLAAPFDGEPRSLATLGLRFASVRWANDDLALVSEFWWQTRRRRTWRVRPGSPEADPEPVFDYSTEDRYNNPGTPLMRPNPWGKSVLFTDENGDAAFLRSQGASPEGNRPFLDKYSLSRRESVRLWRSEAPLYEWPFVMIDAKEGLLVTSRESVYEPPNYFLRKLGKDEMTQLTRIPHPTPKLKGLHKELIRYKRADGVELSGMLYLPPGKKPEDGPFPVLMWAYPREYKSAASAGQVRRSPYRFTRISPTSSLIYLAAGYAIFNDPIMPIIGEGEKEPNDSYVEQLVSSAEAAVDELVERGIADRKRIAIAGHSYGAFMVANLLAHSDVFATGVARSGAYNRTLTPFGFQAEQRTFWEAPEIYFRMSPFMHADRVNEPIPLIHGGADNNSGTFPIQSERFYHALKGHGVKARLVMLPHESHGYRARESVLHMLWETTHWLETYVGRRKGNSR